MDNYTKNGLIFLIIGIIISTIATGLSGVYSTITAGSTGLDMVGIVGFGIIGGIGGFVTLVGAILFLIGRKEFGEPHQKFVLYAVIIIIVGIVISGIVGGIGTFISIAQSFEGGTSVDMSLAGYSIFASTIIGSIMGGLTYILALYHLEDDTGKKILYLAFIISVIIAVVIGYYSMGAIEAMFEDIPLDETSGDYFSSLNFTQEITSYTSLGVISNILWLIALYLPLKRIQTGDLIPQSITPFSSTEKPPERICPNCNKAIPTDATTCPYCGKTFEDYR